MRHAERVALVVDYTDYVAGLRVTTIQHITRENPKVTRVDAVGALAIYAHGGRVRQNEYLDVQIADV
jgi:hypothetical protein